jgi:hypothetical protein
MLRADQKRALCKLKPEQLDIDTITAAFIEGEHYGRRRARALIDKKGMSEADFEIAVHHSDNKIHYMLDCVVTRIYREKSLLPLIEAIDTCERDMATDPTNAEHSILSHGLYGMAGQFLNLTLQTHKSRGR